MDCFYHPGQSPVKIRQQSTNPRLLAFVTRNFVRLLQRQFKTFLFTKSFPEFKFVYRVLEALLLMPR